MYNWRTIQMKISFKAAQKNGKNLGHSKEVITTRNLIAFEDGQFYELATVRWYMSRSKEANRIYCSIWVNPKVFGEYTAGSGFTSGYGFCKQSDSFERALNSAGIYSSEPISCRGMSTVDEFLELMAKTAGFKHAYVAKG